MDISAIKRDSAKVEGGEWVGDIPGFGDVRLRVRGLDSTIVVATRSRKERRATRDERERDGTLKPEVARRIFGEVLHEAVLLEWDGLTDAGKPVAFDADLAKEWLTNKDFTPFADAVVWAAGLLDRSRSSDREDVGNGSRKPSSARSGATS